MKKINVLIGLSIILTLASCSVEKRRYTDGYHVDWHRKQSKELPMEPKELQTEQNVALKINRDEELGNPTFSEIELIKSQRTNSQINNFTEINNRFVTKTEKKIASRLPVKNDFFNTSKSLMYKDFNRAKVETLTTGSFDSNSETELILLIILALFLPPLAVYLYEGSWTKTVTINLILTLIFFLPGVIHALIVILG